MFETYIIDDYLRHHPWAFYVVAQNYMTFSVPSNELFVICWSGFVIYYACDQLITMISWGTDEAILIEIHLPIH